MFEIFLYRKSNGEVPVLDYLQQLSKSNSKDFRIKKAKIVQYIRLLEKFGTRIGEPIVKHLSGEIWELRPCGDRVMFAAIIGGRFVLLHIFQKKTQKTPNREIEQAKRELKEFIERNDENEKWN